MMLEDFGLLELQNYVAEDNDFKVLEERYQEDRENIYASCYASYSTELGFMTSSRTSTEDAAILLADLEESYKSLAQKYRKKTQALRRALNQLAVGERTAFENKFFIRGDWNGTDDPVELAAIEKVCRYLKKEKQDERAEKELGRKSEIKRQVAEWKQSQRKNTAI